MAATLQAALAVVKFYFLAAVLVVEAEEALAAGRCSKVIWKFTFASEMRKQSTAQARRCQVILSVAQKTVGQVSDITTTY
jgi:hypothetical protein